MLVSIKPDKKQKKTNFKTVDNFITEENVNSHFQYEFIPNQIESQLTNLIVDNLETHNTDRARPCISTFYRLSKIAGKYNSNMKQKCVRKILLFLMVVFVLSML